MAEVKTLPELEIPEGAIDVSKDNDGTVWKLVTKPGTSEEKPGYGCKVSVHYTGTLTDGTKFDSSRDRGDQFQFDLGKKSVIAAWDAGVASMCKGERATLYCRYPSAYGENGSPPKIPACADLIFDVELFGWKGDDLSPNKDESIMRTAIVKGNGYNKPNDGANVQVHLVGAHDGRVFDERDVTFNIGEGDEHDVCFGVEHALKKFIKGETSRLDIAPQHAFGFEGRADWGVPPNATVQYTVTLNEFEKGSAFEYFNTTMLTQAKEAWELTKDEKLTEAELVKSKGTTFFKKGAYAKALIWYKKIVDFVEHEKDYDDPEKQQRRDAVLLAAYLNSAQCQINLREYVACVANCDKALGMDPVSEKALYRRAKANFEMANYDLSKSDYQAILTKDPGNKAAKNGLTQCDTKIKQFRAKEKRTYAGMFDKFAKHDELKTSSLPPKKPAPEKPPADGDEADVSSAADSEADSVSPTDD